MKRRPLLRNFKLLTILTLTIGLTASSCKKKEDEKTSALAFLQGDWIRSAENDLYSDGIKLTVENDEGTITDPAGSDFEVGDLKWTNLVATDDKSLTYSDLGTDGSYYDGVITIINDTLIVLEIQTSRDDNIQNWVKDDGTYTPGLSETVELECNYFQEDRVLVNGSAEIDYLITCNMEVEADVTIQAGTTIAFETNAGLAVTVDGSLNAVGSADRPITFRGVDHDKGYWRGIEFQSTSSNNVFDYVLVEDAGSNYVYCCYDPASITVRDGELSLRNSTLRNGKEVGLLAMGNSEFPEYENVTITTHEGYAAYFDVNVLAYLDGEGSDYSGNDENYFYIDISKIEDEMTIPPINIPYLLEGNILSVEAGLTIDAGVEIAMLSNAGIVVTNNGYMHIAGIASNPVTIRGQEAEKGYWRGIHYETNSSNNRVEHAQISDAGSNYVYCCGDPATITFDEGRASIQNSTLSNGDGYGIIASAAFEFNEYANITITGHEEGAMQIAFPRLDELDGMDSYYSGNTVDYIEVHDTEISDPVIWQKVNVPYLLEGQVFSVEARLDIEPGVHAVFDNSSGIAILTGGIISAEGSSSDPIIFEGINKEKGVWRGIHVESSSTSNIFSYVELSHAGSQYVYCCNDPGGLYIDNTGEMVVENSTFSDNAGCAIVLNDGGGELTQTGNTFTGNDSNEVCNY